MTVMPPRPAQSPSSLRGRHTSNAAPPGALVLTVDQVAEALQVSRWFVYDHRQELGGFQLGKGSRGRLRFLRERVEDYLLERATGSQPAARMTANAAGRKQKSPNKRARRVALLESATGLRPESEAP